MLMERIEMLETYVDNLSMKETVSVVNDFIANKRPLHLMGVNADMNMLGLVIKSLN